MTKNKLLETYESLKQKGMNIYIINALKEYTDEEIDNILNSKYIEIILNLILSEAFNLLTKKQRLNIINIINNTVANTLSLR